jgi:transposase
MKGMAVTTMTRPPQAAARAFGGVDTHQDVHVAAALDELGRLLGTASFTTTLSRYRQLWQWMRSWGELVAFGVEGTGSWGAGLARHLTAVGIDVREVMRPNRQHRRRYGKSDKADAIGAAHAVRPMKPSAPRRRGPVRSRRMVSTQARGLPRLTTTDRSRRRSTLRGTTSGAEYPNWSPGRETERIENAQGRGVRVRRGAIRQPASATTGSRSFAANPGWSRPAVVISSVLDARSTGFGSSC